jgi:hypothetical protein
VVFSIDRLPSRESPGPEIETTREELVAGRPWVAMGNFSRPATTVYSPKGEYGYCGRRVSRWGYWVLAMDLEGADACDQLASKEITPVLLKYRVPGEGHPGSCP